MKIFLKLNFNNKKKTKKPVSSVGYRLVFLETNVTLLYSFHIGLYDIF